VFPHACMHPSLAKSCYPVGKRGIDGYLSILLSLLHGPRHGPDEQLHHASYREREREREQTSLLTRDFVALDLAGCSATSLSLSSNLSACCLCMAKRYTCVAWNYLLVDKTVSHQQHPAYRYQSTTGRLGLHYIHSFNFPTSLTRQW
jgi:hypothetical protein